MQAGEAIAGKRAYEEFAKTCGVKVKRYHANNHPFKAQEFMDNLKQNGQTITYLGVGVHHQNGVAKQAI